MFPLLFCFNCRHPWTFTQLDKEVDADVNTADKVENADKKMVDVADTLNTEALVKKVAGGCTDGCGDVGQGGECG